MKIQVKSHSQPRSMLTIDQIIEGEIENLAFGGAGILRYGTFVVFVPFTVPGDKIACKITEVRRSFAKGVLVEILIGSKNRSSPLCPYFGTCGGCQLQNLDPTAQLHYKLHVVADALKRIGQLSFPPLSIHPAKKNWGYRKHITLHLRPKGGFFEAGYIGQDNRSLVFIEQCPIFCDPSHPILHQLQTFLGQLPNPQEEKGRVIVLKNHRDQFILSFQFHFEMNVSLFEKAFQNIRHLSGIFLKAGRKEWKLGDIQCEEEFEGLNFRYSPQTFIQNNPEQSGNILRKICSLTEKQKSLNVLDLYCGYGITSLLLGKQGHSVMGMEWNRHAIQFAKQNGAINNIKKVQFQQGDVEKLLPYWLNNHRADLVIVNPPREGLSKKVVQSLVQAKAETLIYISCMPPTLGRDLKDLNDLYQIQEGHVYDMFPQTGHVETLVVCQKKENAKDKT